MRYVITHAAWADGRKESLARMLDVPGMTDACPEILASRHREHPAQWAQRLWQWVADQPEPVVCLEDDVALPENFPAMCEAVLAASGGQECVSLHLQAPGTVNVQFENHWCRSYWLSTVACIMTPAAAGELVEYCAKLPWQVLARVNHDNLAIWWAWARQKPFLATIPGLCRHDNSIPSTFGYDAHANRQPHVTLDVRTDLRPADPTWWGSPEGCPHVDNPWATPLPLESIRRALADGGLCVSCAWQPARVGTQAGLKLCARCLHQLAGAAMGLQV